MRPNKDHRTEIILYGLLLIPLLFAAAALAQATEQAQGLAEITAVLSEILHTPSMLRWCASTPKFLLAVISASPCACSVACASAAAANSSGISNSPYRMIPVRRSLFGRRGWQKSPPH